MMFRALATLRGAQPSLSAVRRRLWHTAPFVRDNRDHQCREFSGGSVADKVAVEIASAPVVVFSKASCPFCNQVNQLFNTLKVEAKCIELSGAGGPAIQDELQTLTGARSVPRVFVGGKFIGGGDDTMDKYYDGSLEKLLAEAGAICVSTEK